MSNEDQIRTLIDNSYRALHDADYERFNSLQCSRYRSAETGEPNAGGAEALRGVVLDDVNSIVVDGDSATAVTRHHPANGPEKSYTNTVTLKREGGYWRLC